MKLILFLYIFIIFFIKKIIELYSIIKMNINIPFKYTRYILYIYKIIISILYNYTISVYWDSIYIDNYNYHYNKYWCETKKKVFGKRKLISVII